MKNMGRAYRSTYALMCILSDFTIKNTALSKGRHLLKDKNREIYVKHSLE